MYVAPPLHLHFASYSYLKTSEYSVTVGFEQSAYTVDEVDSYQLACFAVLSGDIAGRELAFDYTTTSGTASTWCVCVCVDLSPVHCTSSALI